jgi:hypothetical protein
MSNIIYKGESKSLQFSIKNSNGHPANLAGGVATWRLAATFTSATLLTKAGVVTNAAGGIVTVALDEVDTDALNVGKYIYELVLEIDGSTIVAAQGTIDILSALL